MNLLLLVAMNFPQEFFLLLIVESHTVVLELLSPAGIWLHAYLLRGSCSRILLRLSLVWGHVESVHPLLHLCLVLCDTVC